MLAQRKRRLGFIVFLLIGLSIAVGLCLFALRDNISLYYTPRQVVQQSLPAGRILRLGGLVVSGSVHRVPNTLKVSFVLTDGHANIQVDYTGLLPSLFHAGQGIVTQGHMNKQGVFKADQVLAKHDATYRPPGVKA